MSAETVHEIQSLYVGRRADDRMMIGCHLVESGPGATWVHFSFSQAWDTRRCAGQNLFHERRIKISLEADSLFRIVPCQQNSLPFAAKVKARRHVDHHR